MSKKLTKEEFIKKANIIHHNKYDYSLIDYKNNRAKIKITCPVHGVFEQIPFSHLSNHGCPECGGTKKLTKEEFIKKAKLIHGNKYDYSLVDFKNANSKVKIICPIHGVFEQKINNHLLGHSCPECSPTKIGNTKNFIEKAKLIHGNKYDYSLVNYINSKTKVKIICKKCGNIFEQTPNSHLQSVGCPNCNNSKGENDIKIFLEKNNILFEEQKKFSDLRDKGLLSYDFYLPEKNLLIEYNGEQHYQPIKRFGGEVRFQKQLKHDKLKEEYAKKNDITLLVISFKDNISLKLSTFLKNL